MSNTPETEVLRISGNVTIRKGEIEIFRNDFKIFIQGLNHNWSGSIAPQDDETGMRLYRVEDIELLKGQLQSYENLVFDMGNREKNNDLAFKSLSEELAQERYEIRRLNRFYNKAEQKIAEQNKIISDLQSKLSDKVADKRAELKETRWRTFIKWCKKLWKTQQKNVSQKNSTT